MPNFKLQTLYVNFNIKSNILFHYIIIIYIISHAAMYDLKMTKSALCKSQIFFVRLELKVKQGVH